MSDKRDPDLDKEMDIKMEDRREDYWRDVYEDVEGKSNIHALRWYVYTREKGGFTKRNFLVSVLHPKWGNIVSTGVEDNVIEEKEQCEAIGLVVTGGNTSTWN